MRVREWISLLAYFLGKRPSVATIVDRWFQCVDKETAVEFYQSWCSKGCLNVRLGDGCQELTKEGFFAAAWIIFVFPPFETKDRLVLAYHAEDECAYVAMDKQTGSIYYVYDSELVYLARSFRELLQQLKDAGWHLA